MKKYILLDFDGVMIPSKPWKPVTLMSDGFYEFSNSAINNLNQIVKETGAEIILITSHKTSYTNSEWIKMFEYRDILGSVRRLDDDLIHSKRINEVSNWFNLNPDSKFVILDDDNDFLPSQRLNFVRTANNINHPDAIDIGYGLTKICAEKAIRILKN